MKYRLGETFDFACSYAWLSTYHHASKKTFYIQDPEQLLNLFKTLEAENLTFIQQCQEVGGKLRTVTFQFENKKITCILIIKALTNIIC